RLRAGAWCARRDTVVVDQLAEWREAGTGEVVERQEIGSVLVVRDGRVARFARHPDLGAGAPPRARRAPPRAGGPSTPPASPPPTRSAPASERAAPGGAPAPAGPASGSGCP